MSTPISRATFLKSLAGCGIAALAGKGYIEWTHPSPNFPCRMLGPSREIGHLLRDPHVEKPHVNVPRKTRCVIVGGGMAGLSAGWWLKKNGLTDFIILDLEKDVGGNSASGKNEYGAYPWGAHYVPIANAESEYVKEFFAELGITKGVDKKSGLLIYDELMLCHEPQERLWKDGSFHDGLVPKRGLQPDESEEMARFFKTVVELRNAVGADGKLAFAIPLDLSSNDRKFRSLDEISMAQWLQENRYTTKPLRWYINYCCRDDYGSTLENVSAWAGLHYFAGRRGLAANAEPNSVITWANGNGYLVSRLREILSANIETESLVTGVEKESGRIVTTLMNSKTRSFGALESQFVIVAAPRFVAAKIISNSSIDYSSDLRYAPWIVANISLRSLPDARGLQPAWDNVSYYSPSLGYVLANHQDISTRSKPTVITYYFPLSDKEPKSARQELYSSRPEVWSERIVKDLQSMHPSIANQIISIDLWPWGHGMICPSVGFIWGATRQKMKARDGNIIFAHSDMSGMSNFEEAQYHGVEAAKQILAELKT